MALLDNMLPLSSRPLALVENWATLRPLLGTHGPESLVKAREAAIREFERVGFPNQKDEEFKYLSLRVLEDAPFGPAYGAIVDRNELAKLPLGRLDAITLVMVNGEFAPELSTAQLLPAGAFVGSFEEAWSVIPEIVDRHLMKVATLEGRLGSSNDERFVSLNTAFLAVGAMVYVPKGVAIERPIHLIHLTKADHGPIATYPRTLIVLEERAEVKLIESYLGMTGTYLTVPVTEVWMGSESTFEHTKLQKESEDAVHIATIAVHQEARSTYTSNNIGFGGKIARNDINVFLDGPHVESWLNGVSVGFDGQVLDNHTRIDHAKPDGNSFEVYKSILGDRAIGVFNGKIFVYQDAQKTDAKQTNQAMLLSPHAVMNTKPQLEIFADDVKCTHGATIGQLRSDAMFYLRSRGIPQAQAEAMLVYAFAAEVIDRITITDVREALEKMLFARLSESKELPA